MSLYQFFASEKDLPEFDNGVITVIRNDNGDVCGLNIPSEKLLQTSIRIVPEADLTYAAKYTNLPKVNYIEWYYDDERAKTIIEYIKRVMENRYNIYLYNIWLSDHSPVQISSVSLRNLSVDSINEIWGPKSEGRNACLKIYKEYGS